MAKPRKSKTGSYTLMVAFNKQRRNLTLGRIEQSEAAYFAAAVSRLCSFRKHSNGSLPVDLNAWVQLISNDSRSKLGELGLISPSDLALTVGELIELFLTSYEARPATEVSDTTKKQFRSSMVNRIPEKLKACRLAELEPVKATYRINADPEFTDDAKAILIDCNSWQRNRFAKSTWSKANGRIREVGCWAVKKGICDYNPFTLLPKPGEHNAERNVHVEAEWVEDAMDMCLDPDTRLILALGRFAGFRTPSEARKLKPRHIDFEKAQLTVIGKRNKPRTMPLFERIRDELERHRAAQPWDRFVISERTRTNSDQNNFNLIKEAIARTEWDIWVRLRQNLRSSCENDLLSAGFSERLVTLWLGHTVNVSRKHYQKLKDSDYTEAVASFSK